MFANKTLEKGSLFSDRGWGWGLRHLPCPLPRTCAVCRAWLGARGQLRSVCLAQLPRCAPAQLAPAASPPWLPFSFTGPGWLHERPQHSEMDWLLEVTFVATSRSGKAPGDRQEGVCLDLDPILGWDPP